MQGDILEIRRVEMISWLLESGHGASGVARRDGPRPLVRISQVVGLLREWRSWIASKADLEPPRTRTFLIDGEERRGMLAARFRV